MFIQHLYNISIYYIYIMLSCFVLSVMNYDMSFVFKLFMNEVILLMGIRPDRVRF